MLESSSNSLISYHFPSRHQKQPSAKYTPSEMVELDDETLLRFIQQKDSPATSQNAVEALVLKYNPDVQRFIASRISRKKFAAVDEIVDDITADVWIIALDKIWDFEWIGGSIKSWLFGIAWRKILEFCRELLWVSYDELDESQNEALYKMAVQSHLLQEAEPFREEQSLEVKENVSQILHELIAGLPKSHQNIIVLRYFDGIEKTFGEIAEILGMKENTVRVYHKRAIDEMKKSLELSKMFEAGN